jgi:pyruvate formate lyase activating enzyme
MGKYLKKFKYLKRLEILPYHTLGAHKYKELNLNYRLQNVKPPTTAQIKKIKNIFDKYLKNVIVRQ